MGALATLLSKLASDNGVELDAEDLAQLGLDGDPPAAVPSDVLSVPLPGHAAGELELFLGDDLSTSTIEPIESKDNLMWYPIIRSGQWAVRPGTGGSKKRRPLKVIAGNSKDQRKEIGLADLKHAFDDEAIQHVTVPSSHANTTLENQGFVRAMKIVDGEFKNKKTKKTEPCKVLVGGYDFTEPDTKGKVQRGTIANRSAGILYDYVNTETGKSYPAVVEHVALTNKPWITGMVSFGRPLSEGGIQTVGLSLSDDLDMSDDEYAEVLQLDVAEDGDHDFLAVTGVAWDQETSPSWLRTQVDQILCDARSKKLQAKRSANNGATLMYDSDYPPSYRCVEAKPGNALIRDGWGDDANAWTAGIAVKNGAVELDDFSKWTAVAKVYMPDDRAAPPKAKEPLADEEKHEPVQLSRLELAQQDRRLRAKADPGTTTNNKPPRGGGNMAGENGTTANLSEEAQRAIQAAEARAKAAEEQATRLSEQVQRLTGTVQTGTVKEYLSWLKSDDGLGLSEERGFGGFLKEVEAAMLADDGEPALQSEHFATDGNSGGEVTFSEGLKRIFESLHKSREGKKPLGEAFSEPADAEGVVELDEDGKPKLDAEGKQIPKVKPEGSTQASEATTTTTTAGKPAPDNGTGKTELSTDEKVDSIVSMSPEMARVLGRRPGQTKEPAAAGKGGGS